MEDFGAEKVSYFIDEIRERVRENQFVKLTLSKASSSADDLVNVYVRLILIKEKQKFSFTYTYKTRDIVKNYDIEEGLLMLHSLMDKAFKIATLFSLERDAVLQISKKGKVTIFYSKPSQTSLDSAHHNKQKVQRTTVASSYLQVLGITDAEQIVIPRMADKFRQINKFLEIVESLMKETTLPGKIKVVDMGAGKGYLTFALYDYLVNKLGLQATVLGIEIRQDLVDFCNKAAEDCGFENLHFECSTIQDFKAEKIDLLIALHACDTATDDALFKALQAKASIIICAPCCHKQIRQQLKGTESLNPILKYGIFKERQYEMVTDTMRALLLEKYAYRTKVFEFVSNEHTRKNIMLTATLGAGKPNISLIENELTLLKKEYGIQFHYLEKLLP